ncbi:MAG: histidine--tRNA ligase [Acidimicrobiia bacterium]|nr:histidine--tRNA ligase [Acidimicrobiia bacterium]
MTNRIQPRTLKGFRDLLPEPMIAREHLVNVAKRVYESYGFSPIDTPALEYTEILLGKGGAESDKQLYRFEDNGGRDVALRFDLTVPFARFAAQHVGVLGIPFKRYHVGPVWRGENTQRGRYREFLQFDFDTIGTTDITADIETVLVVHDLFDALDVGEFTIRINDRRILNGLLEQLTLLDASAAVLRALDKLPKVGAEAVHGELVESAGAPSDVADQILEFASLRGTNDEILDTLEGLVSASSVGERGVVALGDVVRGVRAAGVAESRVAIDVSIARGLDYYTGTILETFLTDLPDIGSVCSGGRYDDLAGLYTSQRLPGIGASLGVDRLLAALDELELIDRRTTPAEVLVVYFDAERRNDYVALARRLRSAGRSVELYPEPRKLGAQLKYADRRGHRVAVIVGTNEWAESTAQIKDLATGQSETVPLGDLEAALAQRLTGNS